ncbi:MAG: hypothetical protein J6C95_07465 [Muribaculaceae bacterium]|nr:hypothetical protein [Muribaculaceae bacterium]
MRKIILLLPIIFALVGCIEDGYTTSPSDQPVFSVDTLSIGTVFTDEPTPTHRFVVRNPHAKQLEIAEISVSGTDAGCFRLNVDGISGSRFQGVDIRGKDSIYVFVEATLPPGKDALCTYKASIDFTTNGVHRSVPVVAQGQNVKRLKAMTIDADTRFDSTLPYQIYDSLVVAPGATLTLGPGARLCFHDKAMLVVRGTLVAEGTAEAPVIMGGDRTGNVVGDISFDIMSRQWTGVFFTKTSKANRLSHVLLQNTTQGVMIDGDPEADYSTLPQLDLINTRLRNSGGMVLEAYHSDIRAVGCEFAEAADGLVYLQGGKHSFTHCTFANYYLFSALGGPSVQFAHVSADEKTGLDDGSGLPYTSASFVNCIIYGNGTDLSHGDLKGTSINFRKCLLKSKGSDDDNFITCIWESDPLYYTERSEYIFDYRLRPESPAIAAGDPTDAGPDWYGQPRTTDLGAYVYTEPEQD